eukprot:TRINITY_DN1081_c0_g1_i4.p1 TRINITY_DN1081_c0_g1~~TRINITY_DN1081_c0_g1_i4.p1  ORF type:complete len:501 (+),score=103.70 TRINITY_DN1081_c0_g1_i4:746-2248(+)
MHGMYKTEDGGQSWNVFLGSPLIPWRVSQAVDGTLFVTSEIGVFKVKNDKWTNITPVTREPDTPWCGISVDPFDPTGQTVITAQHGGNWPFYRSTDGGQTWTNIIMECCGNKEIRQVPWWEWWYITTSVATFIHDPHHKNKVWLTNDWSVWVNYDISNYTSKVWYSYERGHEEVFAIIIHSTSEGVLLVGTADDDGFWFAANNSFNEFPQTSFLTTGGHIGDTTGIASAWENPKVVVRSGTGGNQPGAYSLDTGKTWKYFSSLPVNFNPNLGGVMAVSPNGKTVVWYPFQYPPFFSVDMGITWHQSKGAPINSDSCCHASNSRNSIGIDNAYQSFLAADLVNSSVFYIYSEGQLYRSNDGSASFKVVSTIPGFDSSSHIVLKSVPEMQGEVWVSTDLGGLWRSSNGGNSFAKITDFSRSLNVAFGKSPPGRKLPTVFVFGTYQNREGIWRSDDFATSWIKIDSPSNPIGDNPWSFEGDQLIYGRVYAGTLGRGVYVGDIS